MPRGGTQVRSQEADVRQEADRAPGHPQQDRPHGQTRGGHPQLARKCDLSGHQDDPPRADGQARRAHRPAEGAGHPDVRAVREGGRPDIWRIVIHARRPRREGRAALPRGARLRHSGRLGGDHARPGRQAVPEEGQTVR